MYQLHPKQKDLRTGIGTHLMVKHRIHAPKLLRHGKHTVHRKTHPTLSLGASLDLAPGPSSHTLILSHVIQ